MPVVMLATNTSTLVVLPTILIVTFGRLTFAGCTVGVCVGVTDRVFVGVGLAGCAAAT